MLTDARRTPGRPPGVSGDDIYDVMIENREVWACANQLQKQHGADAWFVASQRADELFAEGEMEGHGTFVRILKRIRQLEALEPAGAVN